jgi:hypothetical protein
MTIKYPKGETVWVSYRTSKGETTHILTSKPARDFYFLYEVLPDGKLNKLGKAKTPTELEKKYGLSN